jgi:hypothetical protein
MGILISATSHYRVSSRSFVAGNIGTVPVSISGTTGSWYEQLPLDINTMK